MNNQSLKALTIAFAVIIVALVGVLAFVPAAKGPTTKTPSVPAAMVSSDGKLTVEVPRSNDIIVSPAEFSGTVTGGGWFFEAVFPVKVLDGDGTMLGAGQARAASDWMTTGTVPWTASIVFSAPKHATGTVVFAKDNPSGMPEKDLTLSIPVRFK